MTDVSLLCTVKNGGELFKQTLESIKNQTYEEMELVIVDDGSTDDTSEVIERFSESVPFPVTLVKTGGIGRGRALNLAVEYTKGTYVAVIDDDDPIHPDKVKLQREAAEANPQYAVISTKTKTILNEDKAEWAPAAEGVVYDVTKRVLIKNPVIHSSVMMKREDLMAVGKYDDTRKSQFETELWLRFVSRGYRIGQMPQALTAKRAHDNQAFEAGSRLPFLISTTKLQLQYLKKSDVPVYYYAFPAARFLYGLIPRFIRVQIRKIRE
jgi:glycosyltransferase involved in cell wall biosynthesis